MEKAKVEEVLKRVLADGEILLEEIPRIDLYMDQIITIFEERLAPNKRDPADKLLTKTMIHNYSKEKLLQPLAGKKYSREHILQILMIYQMKQVLSIQDIKKALSKGAKAMADSSGKKENSDPKEKEMELVEVYQRFLNQKSLIREQAHAFAESVVEIDDSELEFEEARLLAVLNLTALSNYMKRTAEELLDME